MSIRSPTVLYLMAVGTLGCHSQLPPLDEDLIARLGEPYRANRDHPYGFPNPTAPAEIAEYAFMVGSFSCRLEDKKFRDGDWIPAREGNATWRAHYVMNGHGILDEFRDEWGSKNVNVRVYSEETERWYVHWTAVSPTTGAVFEARDVDGAMVMESEQETASGFAYIQRTSFKDMTNDQYLWTSEVVYENGDSVVIGTIHCVRDDA